MREAVRHAVSALDFLPSDDARFEAEHLLAHAVHCARSALYARPNRVLTPDELNAYRAVCSRRAGREPLQYILGSAAFMDFDVRVDPRVLIPRPETEELVEAILARLPAGCVRTFCDVGTGSGCIAIALARAYREARGTAVDLSSNALDLARENARALGVASRIHFVRGDLLAGVEGPFDLIVSNPPYVAAAEYATLQPEIRDHEPKEALVAGEGGTVYYRRLLEDAPDRLSAGGWLFLELADGACGRVVGMVESGSAWGCWEIVRDVAGIERMLAVQRRNPCR